MPLISLPVAAPVAACFCVSTFSGDVPEDCAIRPAPGVFPVRCFVGIVCQVQIPELMALAVLHLAKAKEEGFSLIVGDPGLAAIFLRMVHAMGYRRDLDDQRRITRADNEGAVPPSIRQPTEGFRHGIQTHFQLVQELIWLHHGGRALLLIQEQWRQVLA